MRYQVALVSTILLFAASAEAQQSVAVVFPSASPRVVWVGGSASGAPKDAMKVDQASVAVPVGDSQGAIYALDAKTGNLASTPVSKAKNGWRPAAKEFDRIGSLLVRVSYAGKPVAAAQVELKDSVRTQSSFLDPSSAGQLAFYAVAPGSLKVTVRYKSGGADASPVAQVFEEGLTRSAATPILEVAVPEKAATLGGDESATSGATQKPTSPPEPTANPFGRFVGILLGLGLAGAVLYFAMQYMRKNSDQVSAKLEQLGVQVPKPQDDEPADAAPPIPMPKAPEPPQKILLDDSAPTPLDTSPMPQAAVAMPVGEPRLVAENGDSLPLDEGELTVGRDVGIGLSLPQETTVSRKHASIVRNGSTVVVKDLGSTNGTYVNGTRVQAEAALRPGDLVQFGAVRFRYEG